MEKEGRRPSVIFVARLRETRDRRGLSQAELAQRMTERGRPMSKQALLALENGRRGVSLDEALALASVLNAAPAFMLTPPEGSWIALTDDFLVNDDGLREWLQFALWNWRPAPDDDHYRRGLRARFEQVTGQLAQAVVDANSGGDKAGTKQALAALVREVESYQSELKKEPENA